MAKSFSWVLTAQSGQLLVRVLPFFSFPPFPLSYLSPTLPSPNHQGMLCFGHISDRIGRRPAVSSYSALTAIAVAGLAYRWEVLSR